MVIKKMKTGKELFEEAYKDREAFLSNGLKGKIVNYISLNGFLEGWLKIKIEKKYYKVHSNDIVAIEIEE